MHAFPPVAVVFTKDPAAQAVKAVPPALSPFLLHAVVSPTAPYPWTLHACALLVTAPFPFATHRPFPGVVPALQDQPLAAAAEPDTQAHVPGPLTLCNKGFEYLKVFFAIN